MYKNKNPRNRVDFVFADVQVETVAYFNELSVLRKYLLALLPPKADRVLLDGEMETSLIIMPGRIMARVYDDDLLRADYTHTHTHIDNASNRFAHY